MDKRKVTAKVNPGNVVTLQAQSSPHSRPASPFKTKSLSSTSAEPASRIRAKVSSSATIVVGRSTPSSNTENSIVKSTTRPPSPFKQSRGHARVPSSSRSAVDVQISRPKGSLAPHELSRQRSLTSTLEASLTLTGTARRNGGSFHPTPPLPPSARLAPESAPTSPAVRVKAKVSSVVKSHGLNASSTPASPSHPSSPPYATTRPIEIRPRATSVTDLSIFGPNPPLSAISTVPVVVHPITTPTFAANPHRYAPRIPSNTASTRFQPLSPLTSRDPDNGVHHVRVPSKVDPVAIPLPPQSPPTSTLSFSSQSSKDTQCSYVSGSTVSTLNSNLQVTPLSAASDVLDDIGDLDSPHHSLGDHPENPDRKIQAEAKTNRKIEDLEITNRSLLAINATLEATKHKQLTEIRELRRKLRESRLMLPPRAYRTLKSSLGPEDMADDEDIDDDSNDNDKGDDGDDEHDETYKRIKGILEGLLETGRRALRAEPRDFEQQSSGVKVLSPEEVRSWRNNMGDDISSTHSAPTDVDTDDERLPQRNPPTASRAPAISEDDSEKAPSRYDEEAIVTGGDQQNAMSLPPITVTLS